MDDLRAAKVDFLTIGQYLQPTRKHAKLDRFWTPAGIRRPGSSGARQGLPDGVGVAADALLLSRRQRFRARCKAARACVRAQRRDAMISHHETRIVPYPADLMYAVVADVEQYPEFLPWVVALRVLSRRENGADRGNGGGLWRLARTLYQRVALDPAARTASMSIQIERPVQAPGKSLALHARRRDMRGGILHRLRIQEPAAAWRGRARPSKKSCSR